MTDHLKFDLTMAFNGGGFYKSIGFDVRSEDWQDIKSKIIKKSYNIVEIREESGARGKNLENPWFWVWLSWNKISPPIDLLIYLQKLVNDDYVIPSPYQFP